jgi:hypothetical protein
VSDLTTEGFDPLELLRVLVAHRVDFVLIGGVAARLHGSPSVTRDLDICFSRSDENLERLAGALRDLGARLRGVDGDVPFQVDAASLRAGGNFTFTTRAGALDVLSWPAGVSGCEELAANAHPVDLGGFSVRVVDIDDLIRMKRAAGRPKDRVEVEILVAVRDEQLRPDELRGPFPKKV